MAFKIDQKKKPIVTIISILAIGVSFFVLFRTYYEPMPKIALEPYMAVGLVTAEEVSKLIENRGKIVLIVMEKGKYPMPTIDAELKTFKETLAKGKVTVAATESVKMDQMMMMPGPDTGLSADLFLNVLQRHLDADAIVSFAGAPNLNDDQINSLGKIPKVVAVMNMGIMGPGSDLKKLFEQNVLQLAIAPRFTPGPLNPKPPTTLREWFDQRYDVITADNVSSLP